uniref:ATP synthase complex subunit 8 n=1 Tax=Insulanoplectron spinosum TaxID=3073471 RepID=A0AAU7BAE9_9ORTH
MPQMAPISWLFMFILFSFTLLMFCSSNYFLFQSFPSQILESKINFNSFNWKW